MKDWLLLQWDRLVNFICRWLCRVLPSRARTIPHATDASRPLLTQFALWRAGKGRLAIYLQHFESPEPETHLHRHRWKWMGSLVLSGWFREERATTPPIVGHYCWTRPIAHRAGTAYSMRKQDVHRVSWWSQRCWTLFVMWDADDDWGYWERRTSDGTWVRFIPWREHIQKRVPSLDTGKVTP